MSSRIEHQCKWDAYMRTVTWAASPMMNDKQSILHLPKEKMEAHRKYLDEMNATGAYFYGSPPRSRFLNWLGHKCLELAWGKGLYS